MVTRKSICLFCSLGCGVAFRTSGEQVVALDYDKENPINRGSLCPRGHYNLELLNHPSRLTKPQIGGKKASWEEAVSFIKSKLKLFQKEEIGLVISSIASQEDAYAVSKLAHSLGTKNVCAAGYPADLMAYQGSKYEVQGAEVAALEELEKAEALLIVGDLLSRAPVLAKRINKVKYGKRGNKIIVIDPNQTHTSWFATEHLINRPGTEAVVLAAMVHPSLEASATGLAPSAIEKAARDFSAAASGVVIVVPSKDKERNDLIVYFAKQLAAASPNKKYLIYYMYGNTVGVNAILDREVPGHIVHTDMLKKIDSEKIKAALMFGENISAKLKFVARSDYFPGESNHEVLLPLASHHEGVIAPPVGAKTNAQIVELLLGKKIEGKRERVEVPLEKVDLKAKMAELGEIKGWDKAAIEPLIHFGNNNLVRNFFWYRVNNRG